MDTTRLDRSLARLGEVAAVLASRLERLSEPVARRRIWLCLCAVALLWILFGLAELTWNLVPAPQQDSPPRDIINPLSGPAQRSRPDAVDIEGLTSWPLFGKVDSIAPLPVEPETAPALDDELAGMEENAEETRLPLTLTGIAFSSDQVLARAMIEVKKEQAQYAAGDELPVGSEVSIARILSDRVLLNNRGKYELLRLFEDGDRIDRQPRAVDAEDEAAADDRQALKRRNEKIAQMAEAHRRREFGAPASLSQVVNIAPVKEGGALAGYRVSAGRDRAQFEALGFRADDMIVAVNGTSLTEPGKATELFRVLHSAKEARFEVLREGEQITLDVGLTQSLGH